MKIFKNCAFHGHKPLKSQPELCNFHHQTSASAHETTATVQNMSCTNAAHASQASTLMDCTPSLDLKHSTSSIPAPYWLHPFSKCPPVHRLIEGSNHICYQLRIPAKP